MSVSSAAELPLNELRILRRDPLSLVILFAMPIFLMAFVKPMFRATLVLGGYSAANGAEQAVPGMAVMFSFFVVANVGYAFFREHGWGTWDRLRATPLRPSSILIGKSIVPLLIANTQLATLFVLGLVLFDLQISGSVVALAAVAVALSLCLVALGLFVTVLCASVTQLNAFANLGALLCAGLAGALAPITTLPSWAQTLAVVTPGYWAMQGFRAVILDGAQIGDVVAEIGVLLGLAALFFVLAAARFRVDERKVSWA